MLRTNNKVVKNKLVQDVLDNFWPKNYGGGTVGLQNLKDQLDAMRYNNRSIYQTALDYVEGGGYLVYHYDCREYLKNLLQETDEEAARFSDAKVWSLYCNLIARTMESLYNDRVEELKRLGKA